MSRAMLRAMFPAMFPGKKAVGPAGAMVRDWVRSVRI
jgi:hypothetical protein